MSATDEQLRALYQKAANNTLLLLDDEDIDAMRESQRQAKGTNQIKDNVMNPEIHSIVEDVQRRAPKNPLNNADVHTYVTIQMARLHALLAAESEKQAKVMIWFTIAIVVLTVALVFVGIVQIAPMIAK